MLEILKFMIIFSIFSFIVKCTIRRRERKRLRKEKEQMLKNQEQMFQVLADMTGNPDFQLANTEVQHRKEGISVGWIIFFVLLFIWLFRIAQPWIEALSVLGWGNFRRMLEIGKGAI